MIKVLIVDDSPTIIRVLQSLINLHPELEVVGCAKNAFEAKQLVNDLQPDVITLDVEMPQVDGLTFLDRLMKAKPTPVLMFSSLTEKNADITLRALELGAVDFIPKSQLNMANTTSFAPILHDKIISVSQVEVGKVIRKKLLPGRDGFSFSNTNLLVAIGASTGGTEAVKHVLCELPKHFPPVVIALHMPAGFTESYAKRLNAYCALNVKEAVHGEALLSGYAYVAQGDKHFRVKKHAGGYVAHITREEKISGHRPSVDALFESVAREVSNAAIGILLTGMGKDGAAGLLTIKKSGGYTLVQDEASCVVYGMPKEAVKLSAHCEQLPLNGLPLRLLSEIKRRR